MRINDDYNLNRMNMEYLFKEHHITRVYENIDQNLQQEIIRMWVDNNVLNQTEAARRVAEVFFIIRDPAGQLLGVSTAYTGDFLEEGNSYWFLRIFIRPDARGVFNLAVFVIRKTVDALRHQEVKDSRPNGVIIIMENQKLWRKGMHRVLRQNGGTFWGKGPKGNEIWYEKFDGTKIPAKGSVL